VPHGLYVKRTTESVGHFKFINTLQEFCDNAYDVGTSPIFKVARIDSVDYLLTYTIGQNLPNLLSYFGLGPVVKKSEKQIGHHGGGAFRAICWLAPEKLHVMSYNDKNEPVSLTFCMGDYLRALEACVAYTDDAIHLSKFIVTTVNPDMSMIYAPVFETVKDRKLQDELGLIASGGSRSCLMALFEFHKGHRLYGHLDKEIDTCLPALEFIYYAGLNYNKSICLENSLGKVKLIKRDTVSDIFMGNHLLLLQIDALQKGVDTYLRVTASIYGKKEGFVTFLVTEEGVEANVIKADSKEIGRFHIRFGYLNGQEVTTQIPQNTTGPDYIGIITSWNGRRNTTTYWNYTWGPKSTGRHIRCELTVSENRKVYSFLGGGDLSKANGCVQRLLDMLMIHLAFQPLVDDLKAKPVISKDIYTVLQYGPRI